MEVKILAMAPSASRKTVMAESMIIEEALAALQQRLHALAEPAAVAMKATG